MSYATFLNFYQTTLGAALSSTATSLTVSSTTGLPSSLASGQFIPMTLTPASNPGSAYEIVYVTGISGSTLTVERGQEGTSALNWNTGDILYSTNTAETTGTSMGSPSTDFQTNTLTASGLITANGGVTVPSGETLTVDGNTAVDTLTASGLITANDGIDVAGGALTVPVATASTDVPQLGQLVDGGSLTNVTSSRSFGTTYTNSTGRFIFVMVRVTANPASTGTLADSISGYINGTPVVGGQWAATSNQSYGGLSMMVPNGATYEVAWDTTPGGATLNAWFEIR